MTDMPASAADRPQPRPRPRPPLASIATVFAIALLLAAIWTWSSILLLGFAAILLAIALRAGAGFLHRRLGMNFRLGVIVTVLIAIGGLMLAIVLAGPAVSEQFSQLVASLPDAWSRIEAWLAASPIAQFIERRVEAGASGGQTSGAASLPSIFGYVTGTISSVIGSMANLVLLATMALFLALDGPLYRNGALRLVPPAYRNRMARIVDEIGQALGRWMSGQALDMAIVAVAIGLGLWLLGVPLALLLGVIAGVTNIIPYIGPFLSAVPAVLFGLTQGPDLAVQVALLFIIVQQVEGNILMPMIQSRAVELPPVLTMLAILAFSALFGFAGVLLATPLLVVTMILVRRIYIEDVLGDRTDDKAAPD
ncbi:AI-2E family transporter [Paracoccus marinaquae]|uniref:AI-2E family transporter n=1 Tax=Paracoccus marinaquae TaxID=2841926 RepID=A0ABS6AGP7_9RHOB|nr:AI-2E family transporter [Paracoccus marinaquae]MBU3028809.1 AI-2E family transporter [Paracoccus marinaquae]